MEANLQQRARTISSIVETVDKLIASSGIAANASGRTFVTVSSPEGLIDLEKDRSGLQLLLNFECDLSGAIVIDQHGKLLTLKDGVRITDRLLTRVLKALLESTHLREGSTGP